MADKAGKIFFYNHPDLNLIAREDWDKNKDLFLDLKAKIASYHVNPLTLLMLALEIPYILETVALIMAITLYIWPPPTAGV